MEQRFQFRLQSCLNNLLRNAIGYCGDGQRELHSQTVTIWDGLRFVTLSIRFGANASLYSRNDA